MMKKIIFFGLSLFSYVHLSAQSASISERSEIISDAYVAQGVDFPGSLTVQGFSQCGIWVTSNYIFATYWDVDRRLTLARRSTAFGSSWVRMRFPDVQNSIDSHCTPTVGVSPQDNSIHLAYGHHVTTLRYRQSGAGAATVADADFNGTLFPPMKNYLPPSTTSITQLTYPNFVVGKDSNLLLFYRKGGSGDGDTYVAEYSAFPMPTWSTPTQIINRTGSYMGNTSRSAYPNDIRCKDGVLYLTWCWRESSSSISTNHDLCYARSADNGQTWYNSAGTQVGGGGMIMNLNSSGLVVKPISNAYSETNNQGETVDNENRVHTFLRYAKVAGGDTDTYYHVWRSTAGTWVTKQLTLPGATNSLGRPKLYCDVVNDVLYAVCIVSGKITIFASKSSETYAKWYQIFTDTVNYGSDSNGYITNAGNLLYVYAHRATSSNSSELDLVKISLNPSGSLAGKPIVAQ